MTFATPPDQVLSDRFAVTVDLTATNGAEVTPASTGVPKVEVVAGKRPRLAEETVSLLRARLRAAACFFLIGTLLFLARNVVVQWQSHLVSDPVLWAGHVLLTVVLAAALVVLWSGRPISAAGLRGLELAIFGGMAAFLSLLHYRLVLHAAARSDQIGILTAVKNTIILDYAIIATYGMFIPNTWRRAAVVVGTMAVLPPCVGMLLRLRHAEIVEVVGPLLTFVQISDNALMLGIAAVTAVAGSQIINTLRTEAFKARRLGQYQLGRRLGAGGMGEVYLAEHQLLKRPCAIKLVRPSNAADPRALARFEREVRATAGLSHWNTVEIYDYGRTDDGTFYYVMEYLPGLSLADLVARHGPLPAGRVIYLVRQVCEALEEAHGKGLIHRDIKPANIFAAERGGQYDVAKLLDFGLVKPAEKDRDVEFSHEGGLTGTPLYMAPEYATSGRPPDRRSDLYSLGAVAYFLLTGQPPFQGDNPLGILIAHARDPVVPPSRLRADVPADLERVVLRLLGKKPADRFPNARELERALAACGAAGHWDADRAAGWWRDQEREPRTPPLS
jgi:serine/threonine-protein kinase